MKIWLLFLLRAVLTMTLIQIGTAFAQSVVFLTKQETLVEKSELLITNEKIKLVEKSIDTVNLMLRYRNIHLVPAWQPVRTRVHWSYVPVYLFSSNISSATSPAVVPEGCRCIYVNPGALINWAKKNSLLSYKPEPDPDDFDDTRTENPFLIDPVKILSFILLHEVGHINQNTSGAKFNDGFMSELNLSRSAAKQNEIDADTFAVRVLKQNQFFFGPFRNTSFGSAAAVEMELHKLGSNAYFGATDVELQLMLQGDPQFYWDSGETHPNFQWRVQNMLVLLHGKDYGGLQRFEGFRKKHNAASFKGRVIYSDSDGLTVTNFN